MLPSNLEMVLLEEK